MSLEISGAEIANRGPLELSIVMPCLNEAETLALCIRKAKGFMERANICGEIIVADNGSTDGSQEIALAEGARLVPILEKGYGSALTGGISAALGRFIIMGDADDSYDFSALEPFLVALRSGSELVMGNRFAGGIEDGAMPVHHRYFGNPVLSGLGNLLFKNPARDFHCGLRGFEKEAIQKLRLQTSGMEFASEMVVKATLHGLRIVEVPTTLSKDGRSRPPHLRSWHDGWRHLRFLLLYSPRWLFLYPGILIAAIGFAVMLALLPGPLVFGATTLDVNTLLFGGVFVTVGFQCITFSILTRLFGSNSGLLPKSKTLDEFLRVATLERCLAFGFFLTLIGIFGAIAAYVDWGETSFGPLNGSRFARITVPSVTALAVGVQIIFSAFFISILQIGRIGKEQFAKRTDRSAF